MMAIESMLSKRPFFKNSCRFIFPTLAISFHVCCHFKQFQTASSLRCRNDKQRNFTKVDKKTLNAALPTHLLR